MTQEEFTAQWLAGSGLSEHDSKKLRMRAEACDCGEHGCQGWRMTVDVKQAIEDRTSDLFEELFGPLPDEEPSTPFDGQLARLLLCDRDDDDP